MCNKKRIDLDDCTLYRLNEDSAKEFLKKYHPRGSCRGQLVFWGVVKDNEILQLISLGRPRFSRKHHVEIMRMCTRPDVHITEGYKPLFDAILALQSIDDVVAYSDNAQACSDDYTTIGMKKFKTTPPKIIWMKNYQYVTANLLRSQGFDRLFGTNYGKNVSNERLMLEHGWLPVYDCGQSVYEYRSEDS